MSHDNSPPAVGQRAAWRRVVAGMSRAVDCFAVCGLPASPVTVAGLVRGFVGAEEWYRPEVLASYPSPSDPGNNHDVVSVLSQLALMSMPEGVDVHIRDPPIDAMAPRTYPLVLTTPNGALVNVVCLSFLEPVSETARAAHPALRVACARKCFCLVSLERTPLGVLRAILRAIHRVCFLRPQRDAPPLADVVASLVDGIPFPTKHAPPILVTVYGRPVLIPNGLRDDEYSEFEFDSCSFDDADTGALGDGTIDSKSNDSMRFQLRNTTTPRWDDGATSYDYAGYEPLLRSLDARNAARVVCALASERRVVLRSRHFPLLVSAAQALIRALLPMKWRHQFIPLLPTALVKSTLDTGDDGWNSAKPFLVGVAASATLFERMENCLVVDLDTNDVLGGSSTESGMPKTFTETLVASLRKLTAERRDDEANGGDARYDLEMPAAATDGFTQSAAAKVGSNGRDFLFANAQRASVSGKRWSPQHDCAVQESFHQFWRNCFRGYRQFLRAEKESGENGKAGTTGVEKSVFDAAGFYRAQVSSKQSGVKEAAAFVRLVSASVGFEQHASAQVRSALRYQNAAIVTARENVSPQKPTPGSPRGMPWSNPGTPKSGGTTDVGAPHDATHKTEKEKENLLFDALLEEDVDETQSGVGENSKKPGRGGGFFGTSSEKVLEKVAEDGYLRAGTVVRAGTFWDQRDHQRRAESGEHTRCGGPGVVVTFRTVSLAGGGARNSPSGVWKTPDESLTSLTSPGHGLTPAVCEGGPSPHALAISGTTSGFPPPAPRCPRARCPPIDPPRAKVFVQAFSTPGGSPTALIGVHGFGENPIDLLERRKKLIANKKTPIEKSVSQRSRSPDGSGWMRGAGNARGRSASPSRSESPSRRNSIDTFANSVFSNPGSLGGSPSDSRPLRGSSRVFGSDESEDLETDWGEEKGERGGDGRFPETSSKSAGKTATNFSFSIFSTKGRSRRKSEANPLLKMEQARMESRQLREEGLNTERGGSAHAGTNFGKKNRRSAQSVGSAEELAAAQGATGKVSAFDGWLAGAAGGGFGTKITRANSHGSRETRRAPNSGSATSESDDDRLGVRERRYEALAAPSTGVTPKLSPDVAQKLLTVDVRERSFSPTRTRQSFGPTQTQTQTGVPYPSTTDRDDVHVAAEVFTAKLRELWALASADAAMPARARVTATAIRAVASPFAPGGAASAAAELAATDLHGVVLALEGFGALERTAKARAPSQLLKSGVALMSLEEEQGESSPAPATTPAAPATAAERKMKAAEAAFRAASAAADEAAARAGRAEEAAAIASTPGALAVVHAAAAAAAAAGDAGVLIRLLAVTRVVSSSSSFSEALGLASLGEGLTGLGGDEALTAVTEKEESFDPAVATANGDVGRVLCRLPGGATLWGDVRTWRGIEQARVCSPKTPSLRQSAEFGATGTTNDFDEWLFHPNVSPNRRRRALAGAMASTGLPPHAVIALLQQLGPLPVGPNQRGQRGLDENASPTHGTGDGRNATPTNSANKNPANVVLLAPKGQPSLRLGRSTAKLWNVVPSTSRQQPEPAANEFLGSGPGFAAAHDCFVENARAAVCGVSTRAFAPDWALDDSTMGIGRRTPFFATRGEYLGDDFDDLDDLDDDFDASTTERGPGGRARSIRAGGGHRHNSSASLLPQNAVHQRIFASPVTAVAAQLTSFGGAKGGLVAAGSVLGAFAVWDPVVGQVVRPALGEWGAETVSNGGDPRRGPHGAITALCFLSDAGPASGDDSCSGSSFAWGGQRAPGLVLGGTRGGGVAAWDVVKGACVLANPGSHAGAVSFAAAAPSDGPGSGSGFGPTIGLTASNAPEDGCVRLWDARTGHREVAAALAGHDGGVTAVSPRRGVCDGHGARGGQGAAANRVSVGAFLTGDGSGVVRAWDWRRAGGGSLASCKAHVGAVTAVTPLDESRPDVAASAGEDGVVRAVVLDGGRGRGLGGGFGGGGGTLIGHLGPVRCLAVIRGVDSVQHKAVSHTEPVVNPFDDQNNGGFDADATGDAAADALLHRANGVGLVSGGDDGAVRLWAPVGFSGSSGSGGPFGGQLHGRTHGGAWSCVGVAHAHGAAVVIAEAGAGFARRGSRFRQSSVLTVSTDNAVAAWSAPSPGALGGWGGWGGGGGGYARPLTHRANSGKRNAPDFATFASSRGDENRRGARVLVGAGNSFPKKSANANRGDDAVGPETGGGFENAQRGAGWAPIRMHHRMTREPPRALAVDPRGGRLVSGMRDGSVSCATLPGWGE